MRAPELAELRERVEALETWRAQHEGRGARDDADRALLVTIAESIGDRRFTSAELIHHASTVDSTLSQALLAADVRFPHDLGVLFRRLHGVTIGGLIVERTDDSRAGAVWRVRLCEDDRGDDRRIGAEGENPAHDD